MGNFSRDTFDTQKRYVSVRLQQGVPLIDADWNEMDDIRRSELQTFLKWFIGDGIPANSDGSRNDAFRIAAMPTPNNENFIILAGGSNDGLGTKRCLVDGVDVFITEDIAFKAQPLHENYAGPNPPVAPDVTPIDPNAPKIKSIPNTAGSYLVYLDVWEWEVGASVDRSHLVNELLGVETCVRLKRSWAVRVFPAGQEDRLPNHRYYLLATINRPTDGAVITPEQITDQRLTGINLSKYLKIPVYAERGSTVVDNRALVNLFTQLRSSLRNRLERQSLFVNAAPSDLDRTLVYFSLQEIFQVCVTGIVQARTNNLNITDALQLMLVLAETQGSFLTTLEQHGNPPDRDKASFIAEYRRRLDLLKDETAANNLINAYLTQQGVNNWLSVASEAASFLSANWDRLLSDAVRRLVQEHPELIQPGGLLYLQRAQAEFLRNFTSFLRNSLIESCQQNSIQPLDRVLPGLLETFLALGIPRFTYITTLQRMKDGIGSSRDLSNDAKQLASTFFDYVVNALS